MSRTQSRNRYANLNLKSVQQRYHRRFDQGISRFMSEDELPEKITAGNNHSQSQAKDMNETWNEKKQKAIKILKGNNTSATKS